MRSVLAVALLVVASCSDSEKRAEVPPKTEGPIQFVPTDAGPTTILGGSGSSQAVQEPQRPIQLPLPSRERRPIDVTLRSSPPGANVAVDGTSVGIAPAFWSGMADGREHEFVFSLPKHAIARYRFVPVSSGVIHARLEPINDERDAGIAPPPEVVPHPEPSAVAPPPSPPTAGPPVDAMVTPEKPAGSGSATPSGSGTTSGPGPQP